MSNIKKVFDDTDKILLYVNNQDAGYLYKEIDGYYVWSFDKPKGYIPSWFCKELAQYMDELNEEWDKELKKELSGRSL